MLSNREKNMHDSERNCKPSQDQQIFLSICKEKRKSNNTYNINLIFSELEINDNIKKRRYQILIVVLRVLPEMV
jgi:hypothetical protein